ncbi:3799_t:CDS:2 [Funneliformis geosporum]|nr:3799_t:CDS:2 [Funneliformis geosporum]
MQTVDIPPTYQTTEPPEPVVLMELDPSPSKKGKEKEITEETQKLLPQLSMVTPVLTHQKNSWTKIRIQTQD